MDTVSLYCLLRNEGSQDVFTLDLKKSKTVKTLKEMIKEEKSVVLAGCDAKDLILRNIQLPLADIDTRWNGLKVAPYRTLESKTRISKIFSDTPHGCLHICVDHPDIQARSTSRILALRCHLLGDQRNATFTIRTDHSIDGSIFKQLIKREKSVKLADVDAGDLILYGVCLPLANLDTQMLDGTELASYPILSDVTKLSSIFSSTGEDYLHICVDRPIPKLFDLHCHLYGDRRNKTFTIRIEKNNDVSMLKNMVKRDLSVALNNVDAKDLVLYHAPLSVADLADTQWDRLDLSSYPILSDATRLSAISFATQDDRLHIIVDLPSEPNLPFSHRSLYPIDEEDQAIFQREDVAAVARNRDSPSTGGTNLGLLNAQKVNRIDAIYNGRPIELTAPPIEIYHPVFAKFRREISVPIEKSSFSADELAQVSDLVAHSLAFCGKEIFRIAKIRKDMDALVDDHVLWVTSIARDNGASFLPNGSVFVLCDKLATYGVTAFTEVKNGIGEAGSDPIHQAQCDYVLYYSANDRRDVRLSCCCPAFLIGIAGPFMIIAGAVFAERFISQPLTEYIFLGGTNLSDRVYEIARVLKALKLCLADLKGFYAALEPPAALPSSGSRTQSQMNPRPLPGSIQRRHSFPHFSRFEVNGREFELEYVKRIPQHFQKAVFKATIQLDGRAHPVVVKFTPTYCARAHQVVYEMHSAPKLWFCELVESVGMFVVVMNFVDGHHADDDRPLPEGVFGTLRSAIFALHDKKLVHGDLRGPNVIICEAGKRAMLLDFDWAGKEGEVFYPGDINTNLPWHTDVRPGRLISYEHDVYMLDRWAACEQLMFQ